MATLKSYPSLDQIREVLGEDELAKRVRDLREYDRTQVLATYGDFGTEMRPLVLKAWLTFYEVVQKTYPEAKLDRQFAISRPKGQDEMEETVLERERTKRYYHPEDFPEDYTEDDIKQD